MIIDGILSILYSISNVLLAPLAVVDIAVDFVSSIPVVTSFLQCVAYLLPWQNILPLIFIVISIFSFRIVMALIKFVLSLIPMF